MYVLLLLLLGFCCLVLQLEASDSFSLYPAGYSCEAVKAGTQKQAACFMFVRSQNANAGSCIALCIWKSSRRSLLAAV